MENRRIDDLFEYLRLLIDLRDNDEEYICTREIGECINEIRTELGIGRSEGSTVFYSFKTPTNAKEGDIWFEYDYDGKECRHAYRFSDGKFRKVV